MWGYNHTDELYHWGVKGMRWGVRKNRRPAHEDYRKVHDKKKVRDMSDEELKARNNRLNMERNYRELTKKANYGKKLTTGFIKGAGTLAGAVAAYGTYKKFGNQALESIGNWVVRGINLKGPLL